MNRKLVTPIVIIGCLIAYFVLINLISSIASVNLGFTGNENLKSEEGADVKIGISDSVGVTIQRNRWYGSILETSESGKISKRLYLLGFISLPLQSKGTNLIVWHIILIASLLATGYFTINRFNKHHYERRYY